ncbi:MAG: hypothetical protein HYS08_08305 [Chlamydiae bacterium]|nr:hypothetical protein [Chlamydiota bacterium]MBI3265985.1 hypothetical protein [Chlamydiota bacterium]
MIKNHRLLEELDQKYLRQKRRTYHQALAIYEALWKEAVYLGKLPLKNMMEGLEKDFRIAKALNHPDYVRKNPR